MTATPLIATTKGAEEEAMPISYSETTMNHNRSFAAHWRLASAFNNFAAELMHHEEDDANLEDAMKYLKNAVDIGINATQRASSGGLGCDPHQADAVVLRCKRIEESVRGRQRRRTQERDSRAGPQQRPASLGLFALDPADAERGDDEENGGGRGLSFARRPLHLEAADEENVDPTAGGSSSPSTIKEEYKRRATVTLYNMSLAHEKTRNLNLAESTLKMALAMVPRSYDPALTSFLLSAMGRIHYRQGLHRNAVDDLTASFEIARLAAAVAAANGGCGDTSQQQGAQRRHHGPSRIDLEETAASTLSLLARIYYEGGESDHAHRLLAELLRVHRRARGDGDMTVAETLFNIGLVLRQKGDAMGALEHVQHFLDHVASAGQQGQEQDDCDPNNSSKALLYGREIAIALHAKGLVLLELDDCEAEGIEALSQSIRVSRLHNKDWNSNQDVARTLFDLAEALHEMGQFTDALKHYNESLRIYRASLGGVNDDETDDDFVGRALCKVGEIYKELGESDGALESFQKALNISRRLFGERDEYVGSMLSVIGNVHLRMGETKKAMRYFADSQRILSSVGAEIPVVCPSPLQCVGALLLSSAAAA